MPKAKTRRSTTLPAAPTPSRCIRLAAEARNTAARYLEVLSSIPDTAQRASEAADKLLDHHADAHEATCRALAGEPAETLAELKAKARVLIDATVHGKDGSVIVHDTAGLTWSLLADLIAA